jgi:hypothetical protein
MAANNRPDSEQICGCDESCSLLDYERQWPILTITFNKRVCSYQQTFSLGSVYPCYYCPGLFTAE